MNLAYALVISHEFSYMGFFFSYSFGKLLLGSFLLILFYLFSFQVKDNFIYAVWNIIYIYLFASEVIYFQYTVDSSIAQIVSIGLVLILLVPISRNKIFFSDVKHIKNSDQLIMFISILLFIPFLLYFRHINLKNIFLIDVYATRELFRNLSQPLTGYIQAPLVRILLPLVIVRSLEKKKYFRVIIAFLMIVYIYLVGALKSVFFGLIVLVAFYKGKYHTKILILLKGISFFTIIGVIVFYLFDNVFLLDIFIRRIFFTPARLNNVYNNHFSNNFTYFSHTPLGAMAGIENESSLSRFVGEDIVGIEGLNANVGTFTEGYVSAGYIGLIIFSLIISLIFLFLMMTKIDNKYFGVVIVYIYYLNTSFLSTLLLTHGLFFFLVVSFLFLRKDKENSVK